MGKSKSENGSKLNARNLKATEWCRDLKEKFSSFGEKEKGLYLSLAILIKIGKWFYDLHGPLAAI